MAETSWKNGTTRKLILASTGVIVLATAGLWLADPDAFPPLTPFSKAEQKAPIDPGSDKPRSAAEVVSRLQTSVDSQTKYLEKLNAQLAAPDSEFRRAEKRFQDLDKERTEARQALADLKKAGKTGEATAHESALKEIETRWKLARNRFDLAIQERKELKASIVAAKRQLEIDQKALDRVSGSASSVSDAASPSPGATTPSDKAPPAPATAAAPEKSTPSTAAVLPESPLVRVASASASSSTPAAAKSEGDKAPADRISREVERAREEAKSKEEAARKAETRAKNITQRLNTLNENIGVAKRMLETDRRRADNEQKTRAELEGLLQQKRAAGAPAAELAAISERITAAQRRLEQALTEARSGSDHLNDLQTELNRVQEVQLRVLHDVETKKQDAEAAEEKILQLQNPFRPRNMVHWALQHGPRLLVVVAGMFIFYRVSRFLSRRIVQLMAQGISKRGSHKDRENRAETLTGVFNSALSLLVLGGGTLMILDEVGIPIVPLMGGAAVLGLAVAFGAQNLIKDYFSGFMVLLEDQYGINDVVTIGSISGLVEHISLRTTVLRDLEGIVHFIPHGTITTVSNQTHGWSRALFSIGIDYKENVDHAMAVLLELGHEMRRDPVFGSLILDDPEMLGVDQLADSSVVIKFFLKTRPLQQWTVKREMLRRLKKRFDELGIEIPYPHQTVHHRYDNPPPPQAAPFSRAA